MLGQVLVGMKFDDKPLEGKKNDPMMPVGWVKTYQGASAKTARIFNTTMGASQDLVAEGSRRMLVNAAYWCLGMEAKIAAKSKVDVVGEYKPTPFGGERYEAEQLSGLAEKTTAQVYTVSGHLEKIIGPRRLVDVTADQISRFAAKLRSDGLAEATIKSYLAHIGAALSWAAKISWPSICRAAGRCYAFRQSWKKATKIAFYRWPLSSPSFWNGCPKPSAEAEYSDRSTSAATPRPSAHLGYPR